MLPGSSIGYFKPKEPSHIQFGWGGGGRHVLCIVVGSRQPEKKKKLVLEKE
jgi:hypothetical protein